MVFDQINFLLQLVYHKVPIWDYYCLIFNNPSNCLTLDWKSWCNLSVVDGILISHKCNLIASAISYEAINFVIWEIGNCNDTSILIMLFNCYARSKIEYASVILSPHYVIHVEALVQRCFECLVFREGLTFLTFYFHIPQTLFRKITLIALARSLWVSYSLTITRNRNLFYLQKYSTNVKFFSNKNMLKSKLVTLLIFLTK